MSARRQVSLSFAVVMGGVFAVVEGHRPEVEWADDRAGGVGLALEQIALDAGRLVVGQDAVAVATVDEVHAAVAGVDVMKGHPTGDAPIVEVAAPVGLVLVPVGRRAVLGRLGEELVVPELDRPAQQRGAERDAPKAEGRGAEVGPEHRRTRLQDLERALGSVSACFPCPVERHLLLVLDDLRAPGFERTQVGRVDRVGHINRVLIAIRPKKWAEFRSEAEFRGVPPVGFEPTLSAV